MNRRQVLASLLSAPLLGIFGATGARRESIVGQPCEGCEAVFDGLPRSPPKHARIAPIGEPGDPLSLCGTVTNAAGHPQAGVIVYAYHADQSGLYPPATKPVGEAARRHGRLRAWTRTDSRGRYLFHTIRPGSYPGRDTPEHIHLHVIEPGRATYYIDDAMFRDDPKLTPQQEQSLTQGRGGSGVATPERRNGKWFVRRDIVLGLGIPGYPIGRRP